MHIKIRVSIKLEFIEKQSMFELRKRFFGMKKGKYLKH